MSDRILTQARLKELLHYCPESGLFTWLMSKGQRGLKGKIAGSCRVDGYLAIQIDGIKHLSHRLAFLYMEGCLPKNQVDHENHTRADNRWCNLRHATNSINQKNTSKQRNNSSGVTGVSWQNATSKWAAYISIDGKRKHLGLYNNLLIAVWVRKNAEREYGYHENHGVI